MDMAVLNVDSRFWSALWQSDSLLASRDEEFRPMVFMAGHLVAMSDWCSPLYWLYAGACIYGVQWLLSEMAAGKTFETSEQVTMGLKSDTSTKLTNQDVVSGKDGIPSDSMSSLPSPGDATASVKGVQSDNGIVCYLPGCNAYASGTLMGVDGQCISQPLYFSSGYLQQPIPSGTETVPCYSWDSTYVGDATNGTNAICGRYLKC